MNVGEASLGQGKGTNAGFRVAVDLGGLAGEAGARPCLGVLRNAVPDEPLLKEGGGRAGRRVSKAVNQVKNMTPKRKGNPRAGSSGGDITEDGGAVSIEGHVFPLERSGGGTTAGQFRILLLSGGEVVVVKAKANERNGIPGEGISDRILFTRDVAECAVKLGDTG